MRNGAFLVSVLVALWAVTPSWALGRAPAPAEGEAPPDRAPASESPSEVDPALVEEASSDEPVDYDESAEAAPSTVDRVLQNRQVQTMVSLFGRGLMVNDDEAEPPTAPMRVRLRPKGSGASFQFTVLF